MMEGGTIPIMARGPRGLVNISCEERPVPDPNTIPVNPSNTLASALDHPPKTAGGLLVVFTALLLATVPSRALTYTRSRAAMTDGITFSVEWSDTLGVWSSAGVSEQLISDDGTVQTVKATIPAGPSAKRFIHLKVSNP